MAMRRTLARVATSLCLVSAGLALAGCDILHLLSRNAPKSQPAAPISAEAARATIASLQGHIALYPTDPCMASTCLDTHLYPDYPVHYVVKTIATTPRAILLDTMIVSNDAENGHDRAFVVDLAVLAPIIFIKTYASGVRPVIALDGKQKGQSLALNAGDEELTKRAVTAMLVLKQAAVAADSAAANASFDQIASDYRAASPQPQPSDEIHKYDVQAQRAVSDGAFVTAAALYGHAIEIAPWWPDGHYDLALVLAEIGDYREAVLEMQRYLTLVPDSPNAHTAQDLVSGWQRKPE